MFDIYILLENKCFLIIITGTFIYVKLKILTLTFIVLFLSVLIPLSHILKLINRCVIQEFIDTEKHYVKDLETIVEVCFLT